LIKAKVAGPSVLDGLLDYDAYQAKVADDAH
jgi:hypothetical protein